MSFERLLKPRSIAVFGGAQAQEVIRQSDRMGYKGEIWPVHPKKTEIMGRKVYRSVEDLPGSPDAAYVGVNRNLTIDIVRDLAARDAGGAQAFGHMAMLIADLDGTGPSVGAGRLAGGGDDRPKGPVKEGVALERFPNSLEAHGQVRADGLDVVMQPADAVGALLEHEVRFDPDRLPDARDRCIETPARREGLFPAWLLPRIRRVIHFYANRLFSLGIQGVGDVEGKRIIAANVVSDRVIIDPNLCTPVNSFKVESDPFALPFFRNGKRSLVPQGLIGSHGLHHSAQR